jgi:nitrate reductase (cytochrome), electron transfer subunit
MTMTKKLATAFTLIVLVSASSLAQNIATTRGAALDSEPTPPKMTRVDNSDVKRERAYPMQPPTIPHKISGYQVDKNANQCLSCHNRNRTQESQAPMVSVTHYMDREGNFLADVSPRRYFCSQCHVTQEQTVPLMDNDFVDIDDLLRAKQGKGASH